MVETSDTARVIAPPPLIALAALLLGLALDWLIPAYVLTVLLTFDVRIFLGVVLVAAGCALPISARNTFVGIGTNAYSSSAARARQRCGVYAYVRNPDVCRLWRSSWPGWVLRWPRTGTLGHAGAGLCCSYILASSRERNAISKSNSATPTGNTRRACRVTASRLELSEISKSFRQSSICAARALHL